MASNRRVIGEEAGSGRGLTEMSSFFILGWVAGQSWKNGGTGKNRGSLTLWYPVQ